MIRSANRPFFLRNSWLTVVPVRLRSGRSRAAAQPATKEPMTATDWTAQNKGAWMALTAAFLGWMFDGGDWDFSIGGAAGLAGMQAARGPRRTVCPTVDGRTPPVLLGAAGGGSCLAGWETASDGCEPCRSHPGLFLVHRLAYLPENLGTLACSGSYRRWAWAVIGLWAWPWSWIWPSDKRPLMAGVHWSGGHCGYASRGHWHFFLHHPRVRGAG